MSSPQLFDCHIHHVCLYCSCDLSSASLQQPEVVGQRLEAEDVGKLTEVDKAQTGRVNADTHVLSFVFFLVLYKHNSENSEK